MFVKEGEHRGAPATHGGMFFFPVETKDMRCVTLLLTDNWKFENAQKIVFKEE